MITENNILMKNEKHANRVVAKVMRITYFIFSIIYILDIVEIFTVDFTTMTVAYWGQYTFISANIIGKYFEAGT